MSRNWLAWVFWLFLFSGQDLLVQAGEYNSNCPDFSQTLRDGCTVSSDCSTIRCNLNFGEKDVILQVKINKCKKPVTITTTIVVPDLHIDWSHEYSSGDIVNVPKFVFTPPGGSFPAGVYIQVVMADNREQLTMMINLLGGSEIGGHASYPVKTKVLDGELPISTFKCVSGIIRWWKESSVLVKAAVFIGALIFLILLIVCFYCCYCKKKCRCCKKRPARAARVGVA